MLPVDISCLLQQNLHISIMDRGIKCYSLNRSPTRLRVFLLLSLVSTFSETITFRLIFHSFVVLQVFQLEVLTENIEAKIGAAAPGSHSTTDV